MYLFTCILWIHLKSQVNLIYITCHAMVVVIALYLDLHLPMQSVWILLGWGVLHTTLCDKVYQWLAAGCLISPGTPISSTKTNCHDIAEILLKVALNTITLTLVIHCSLSFHILIFFAASFGLFEWNLLHERT